MRRNTLLCTVGTSLFESNLKRLSEDTADKPDNWRELKKFFEEKNWKKLANELLKINPKKRICSAEINTIEEAKNKKWLELQNIIFLVSDTEAGRSTGEVLKVYFENRDDLKLKHVEYRVVDDLQDQFPKKFKTNGLRNLVRVMGEYIGKYGAENIAIDATGGYKAQIAIAVLLGQALDIPVYYKHERFSEIIDFPPMPVSLDYDLIGSFADILVEMEKGRVLNRDDIEDFDEKLRIFLNEVELDEDTLFELNPIGQLYLTSFRLRIPMPRGLVPLADNERELPTFGDNHHYPKGFKDFVNKVWQENKWIKTCHSLPFAGQAGIRGIGFKVKKEQDKYILVGTYKDKSGFGARFKVVLESDNMDDLIWVSDYLNRKYSS